MTQGRRGFFAKLLGAARELDAELDAEEGPRFSPPPVVGDGQGPAPDAASTAQIPRRPGEARLPAKGDPQGRPPSRPPGALPEAGFAATCTRCKACVEVCPEATLALDPLGFPVAEPWRSACALCPSTPCIAACEPRALVPTPPHEIRLGLVVVLSSLCLNQDEDLCDRCLDWCPVPGAITTADSPVPTVDAQRCTGCGLCVAQCPALPRAIAWR